MKDIRYIYRVAPWPLLELPDGADFLSLTCVLQGLRNFGLLLREFGWAGAFKALLKIATGRRFFFGLLQEGRLVSHVWSTEHSPRYPIETRACVLGPLLTRPETRRRGFASALLQAAGGCLAALGYRAIYIDTTPGNIASRRAIARAGFAPYAVLRGRRIRKLPGR